MKKLQILLYILISTITFGQSSVSPLPCVEYFYHGVASGDPLPNAVIIWTRVTPNDFTSPVVVTYKMATDSLMENIVATGSTVTNATKDYTVKFDVNGLEPNHYYFYEFTALGTRSPRGRTKTAPQGDVDSLRFAVVSCANLEAGYFNVYEAINNRNDVEAVLMLGDYIYEYGIGQYGQDPSIDREFEPSNEILTLEDYRVRYSIYHMDHSLQKLHQNFPWICVWDDHESANDAYKDGAENHNPGEGNWSDRKAYAQQAYFEWLPIRAKAPGNYEIYRTFHYGDLLDLIMVDTRLQGREQQGEDEENANRTMLGNQQYDWLINELDNSTAQHKVLGNQVILAPITVFGVPINGDAWDGYPAEREKLLEHIRTYDIENFTVITGDVHTSWAFNLKQSSTSVGVEFVTPSVTSPGAPINGGSILMIENPHLKYVELTKHGFILLDMNKNRIQADWFFMNTIADKDASHYWAKSFYSTSGTMTLNATNSVTLPHPKYDVAQAPLCPRISTAELVVASKEVDIIGVYPNPFQDLLHLHISSVYAGNVIVEVIDMMGKTVVLENFSLSASSPNVYSLNMQSVEQGIYVLRLRNDEKVVSEVKVVK